VHLSALNIHPVKSLRGFGVQAAELDKLGAVGDRRFLVVDPTGKLLTQRTVARMATVGAFIDDTSLTLRAEGFGDISVGRLPDSSAPIKSVSVFATEGLLAEDCGDPVAQWLTLVLGVDCRLVRAGTAFNRPVVNRLARPGDVTHFADAYPLLVISEASLADLNERIRTNGGIPVTMDRFRTNMVVSGCAAFAEDTWKSIRIGEVVFRAMGPCSRCIMTTTDQLTGVRGIEPLKTLATFRIDTVQPTAVNFGQNLVNESKSGVIRVGDSVEVLD
jgi:uncharacterized protein YcbX